MEQLRRRLPSYAAPSSLASQMMRVYETIGRYDDALAISQAPPLTVVGLVTAYLRDDQEVLNRWKALGEVPPDARGTLGALGPIVLARLGLPHLARTEMPRGRSDRTTASIVFYDAAFSGAIPITRGEIALAEGNAAEAVSLIQQGLAAERVTGSAVYFLACEALARAWLKQNNPDAAVAALEDAYRQRGRSVQGSGAFWLSAVWELAQLYRQVGRQADAARLEAELRDLLIVADRDHPIAVRLRQTGASGTTP
jgi:hypothetical protein